MCTNFRLWVVFFIALYSSSCKHDKEGNFTIQMDGKYGNQNFVLGTPNTDLQGRRIQIEKLKFYLSHITLVKDNNEETEIKDVALINFENPGSIIVNADVNGDFKAIKFGLGVDSIQNNTDPLSVPSSNPLSGDNGMYWSWLKYQFEILEARCDTTSTGSGIFNWFPLYHIGGNAQYRQVVLNKTFSVCCNNKSTVTLTLDVEKIFYGSTQTLDIITESTTQMGAGDDPNVAVKFVDNFSSAFRVN